MKAVEITCRIKQEILDFILKETQNNNYRDRSCGERHDHRPDDGLDGILEKYLSEQYKAGLQFVETPPLPE
jgi:hypothetical protein